MAKIKVTITGDTQDVQMVFGHMQQAVGMTELGQFLRDDIDPYLRGRIAARFAGEGDDVVGQWLPLAASTVGIRQSRGLGGAHPINVRTHMMKDFLVTKPGDIKLSGLEATLTSPGPGDPLTDQKIRTAQQGKSYPNTPPRPVIGVNTVDLDYIHIQLTRYLFGA